MIIVNNRKHCQLQNNESTVRARGLEKILSLSSKGLVGGEISQIQRCLRMPESRQWIVWWKTPKAMGANALLTSILVKLVKHERNLLLMELPLLQNRYKTDGMDYRLLRCAISHSRHHHDRIFLVHLGPTFQNKNMGKRPPFIRTKEVSIDRTTKKKLTVYFHRKLVNDFTKKNEDRAIPSHPIRFSSPGKPDIFYLNRYCPQNRRDSTF